MKVFVDFENALLNQNINQEEFWFNFGLNGINYLIGKKPKVDIKYLPYMSKTLYILDRSYKECEIYLISDNKNNDKYIQLAIKDLHDNFGFNIKEVIYLKRSPYSKILSLICNNFFSNFNKNTYNTLLKKIKDKEEDKAIIGGNLGDYKFFSNFHEISIINNFFSGLVSRFLIDSKFSRTTGFLGFFNIFFGNLRIIWPILSIWPVILENHYNFISFNRLSSVFFACLGFLSFTHLLRVLVNLQEERAMLRDNLHPLCGESFIFDSYRLELAAIYLLVFILIGLYSIKFSLVGCVIGIIISLAYFVFMLSTTFLRWGVLSLLIIILQLASQYKFAIKLFYKIFI